jgi:uncharacterized protein (UPF0218 family)
MGIAYRLTPELHTRLKEPIGTLVQGSFIDTMNRFREMVEREKPPRIIAVGDTVTRNLNESHIPAQLSIVDNRSMRKSTRPVDIATDRTVYVENPQATITDEAVRAIQDSLRSTSSVKIVVDGEEDLLTLIAVMYAPENSFVLYGQPYKGIVVVKVTTEKRAKIAEILKAMEDVRKAK